MSVDDPEVIDVRDDEKLDLERLEPWLREHLPGSMAPHGADISGPLEVRQFGGGHANLTYLIRFGEVEYVLRRPPLGPVAPTSHDMAREHRVLSRIPDAFPLAPRSFLYCDDASLIGADFHVLERRHGVAMRIDLPERFHGQPDLNRRIGLTIIDTLADLHRLDTEALGLDNLGHPDGFVERQLNGWVKRWEAAKDVDVEGEHDVIGWLTKNVPPSAAVSLLHNDYKLDNMLVDPEDPATPTAVLDWDMCTRGDPLMDLGYLLNFWNEPDEDPAWIRALSMPTWREGFPRRDEIVERYAQRTGFDVDDVTWYHVFGVFKLAVIIQQIYIRYLRGQTQDERFAGFGERVRVLIDKAKVLAGL